MKISEDKIKLPSNENFGKTLVVVFSIITIASYLYKNFITALIFFVILILILNIIFFSRNYLTKLNNWWYSLGILLGKITNPLVLGFVYLFLIIPVAIIRKPLGGVAIKKLDKGAKSYWINREIDPHNKYFFKNQF